MTEPENDRRDEHNEPNEFGFAGGGTAPEPERETHAQQLHDDAETIAVSGSDWMPGGHDDLARAREHLAEAQDDEPPANR